MTTTASRLRYARTYRNRHKDEINAYHRRRYAADRARFIAKSRREKTIKCLIKRLDKEVERMENEKITRRALGIR